MKRNLLTILAFLFVVPTLVYAQCDGRYINDIFPSVNVTSNIVYGNAISYTGAAQDLQLDFYEPAGDTASERPLIILAHGGFFSAGSKTDGDMVDLCNAYAKKGYACASINYRLGWSGFIPDSIDVGEALIRAVQDAKAAVRFFKQDAATADAYRIDPDQIFVGGSSAGGFISVHYGFFRDLALAPAWAQDLVTDLGGLEGNSGTPGFDSEIKGVLSFAGAITDTSWMSGDIPIFSTHSEDDGVVPYACGDVVFFFFFPIVEVCGSSAVHQKADRLGVPNNFLSFTNAGHVPHINGPAEFNLTVENSSAFMESQLECAQEACTIPTNLSVSSLGPNSAVLSWNPVQAASGYQLQGGRIGGSLGTAIALDTFKSINILSPNNDYQWQVRAYCDPDFSDFSTFDFFSTPSMREGLEMLDVAVYPNPAGDVVYINTPDELSEEEAIIEIVDLNGRILKRLCLANTKPFSMDVSDLSVGMYQLMMDGKAISRLIISR